MNILFQLFLFKLVSNLYPTSDYRHPIVTPCLVFMSQILLRCKIRGKHDITKGLFVCTLILEVRWNFSIFSSYEIHSFTSISQNKFDPSASVYFTLQTMVASRNKFPQRSNLRIAAQAIFPTRQSPSTVQVDRRDEQHPGPRGEPQKIGNRHGDRQNANRRFRRGGDGRRVQDKDVRHCN